MQPQSTDRTRRGTSDQTACLLEPQMRSVTRAPTSSKIPGDADQFAYGICNVWAALQTLTCRAAVSEIC